MTRDAGLENMLAEDLAGKDLAGESGLTTKPMFGGLAWLHAGHLCLAVRTDGLLARLGPGRDGWALAVPGIRSMAVGDRRMPGWVWASPDRCGDDALRGRLIADALAFVRRLPAKRAGAVPLDLLGVREPSATAPRVR